MPELVSTQSIDNTQPPRIKDVMRLLILLSTQSIDETQLLSIKDVMRLLGISRSTVYRLVKENRLPQPLKLSARASRFRLSAINLYLDEREKSRTANTPAIRTEPLSPVTQDATTKGGK